MLRKGKGFFIMLFMASMLFTLLNYLPVIEEENPTQRIELCKKHSQDSSNGDDGDETDEDATGEFLLTNSNTLSLYDISLHYSNHTVQLCSDFDRSRIKPPPRG